MQIVTSGPFTVSLDRIAINYENRKKLEKDSNIAYYYG